MSGTSGHIAVEGHDFMDAIAMYLHPPHHKDDIIMSGAPADSAAKSPVAQEIDLRVQHQIERRRLWAAAYIASFGANGTSLASSERDAEFALEAFDKTFPVIHAQ